MDSIDNYQVGNLLGRGGFASVFRARCKVTEQDVAIKMVDKQQMKMKGMNDRVRQEVAIHHRLKHPSILELITFFEDENYVYLVLELCHNGELAKFQKLNNMVFTESLQIAKYLSMQCVICISAMFYINKCQIRTERRQMRKTFVVVGNVSENALLLSE